jgi:hypothetical protein
MAATFSLGELDLAQGRDADPDIEECQACVQTKLFGMTCQTQEFYGRRKASTPSLRADVPVKRIRVRE